MLDIPMILVYCILPIASMIGISITYFVTDDSYRILPRLASSAHGVLAAVLYGGALFIGLAGHPDKSLEMPYTSLFVIPLASVFLSFLLYRGNKWIHLLQIVNVFCMLLVLFIGNMTIGADYP